MIQYLAFCCCTGSNNTVVLVGMMGQLVKKEADISLILQLTSQRADFVDFYKVMGLTGKLWSKLFSF